MKSMISLSFDDGREDNVRVALPILKRYGHKATFNITTGYVDGSSESNPCEIAPITVDDVVKLHKSGHEIACHGDKHLNTTEDILCGYYKLSQWLGCNLGFASPGTGFVKDDKAVALLKQKGLKYIRLSMRYNNMKSLKVFTRKLSRLIPFLPCLYRLAYQDTCFANIDSSYVYSVPVLHSVSFGQLKNLIEYAIKKDKHLVLMLHSVRYPSEEMYSDPWTMDVDIFNALCAYLAEKQTEGKCEVLTTMQIYDKLTSK